MTQNTNSAFNRNWIEITNPLTGLSLRQAQNIFDSARRGNYARIQYIYNEIEQSDHTLLTCVERRSAALAGLGWKIAANGADKVLADEQKQAITSLAENLDHFSRSIEHFGSAFFRGYAHANIWRDENGTPTSLEPLNSWNFCYDKLTRTWFWNPDCLLSDPGYGNMKPIPKGELVSITRPRAIDYPALSIYIRHALAERDWGRFLERFGIPPVNAIMPQGATEEDRDLFKEAAEKAENGRGGAWPSGTTITYAAEARGVNPFLEFIQHQEKAIVLLATGGTLTSLAESGSGTLAGNAQMEVWDQIVARDATIIGEAIDEAVFRPYLKAKFSGQPILAHFELGKEAKASPTELFEIATKARAAGYRISQAELEEATGYSLEPDVQTAQGDGLSGQIAPFTNAYSTVVANATNPSDDLNEDDILTSFVKSNRPGAKELAAFVKHPTQEEADKLMERLEEIVQDDALASILEGEMAKAIAKELATNNDALNN